MSVVSLIVEVSGRAAVKAAQTIPGAEGTALPTQVRVFGDGASALVVAGEAAAHDVDPIVALTAVGAGIAIVTAVGLTAPISVPALMAGGATLAQATIMSAAMEMAIAGGSAWLLEPVIQALFDAFDDYGWALDNPQDLLDGLRGDIPGWLQPGSGLVGNAPNLMSPLVLDLDGNGIEVTKMGYGEGASGVYFDLDNDGFAERTAWVTGGDGLLAWDQNSNGAIDNQSELFGNSATHADGFAHLATLDTNTDDKITSADTNWSNLRVWIDANEDGITDGGELHTLNSLGITEVSLSATPLTNTYINENLISDTSTFVIGGQTRTVSDVWFRNDGVDSRYLGDVELDEAVFFLPTLKGFGTVKDLHVAMSDDADLLDLVSDFVSTWSIEKFADDDAFDTEIQNIFYAWAGVDGVSPTSRGAYVDAQKLEFLERFFDKPFLTPWNDTSPTGTAQGNAVHIAFDYVFLNLKSQLIMQVGGTDFFTEAPVYSYLSGELGSGTISTAALTALTAEANASGDRTAYWKAVAEVLLQVKDYEEFTSTEATALNSAIQASLPLSSWSAIAASAEVYMWAPASPTAFSDLLSGGTLNDLIYGGDGDDIIDGGTDYDDLYGDAGNDIIYGGYGGDDLYGGTGNDELHGGFDSDNLHGGDGNDILYGDEAGDFLLGGDGNDTLAGGASNDNLYGEAGDDIYLFEADFGTDVVDETYTTGSGTDVIQFGEGIALEDIRFWKDSYNTWDLSIYVGSSKVVLFRQHYDWLFSSSSYNEIESIKFADNSTLNITGIDLTYTGTSANEDVFGTSVGDDTLKGLGGSDTLYGFNGDDIYFFSAGSGTDIAYEELSEGADSVRLSGYDAADVRLYTDSNGFLNVASLADPSDVLRVRASTSFFTNFENRVGEYVEELIFDDTTLSLTGGLPLTGSSSADTIFGTAYGDVIDGAIGDDTLYGNGGNDTLSGGADNDYLYGGAGNDILNAGDGADTLYGEGDSDTFRFGANTTSDTITDFSLAQNDKIDISQLIEGYDPVTHAITDWVEITTSGWNSVVKIDADGGGNSFVQVATINGVTGLEDEAALVTSGHLIAA